MVCILLFVVTTDQISIFNVITQYATLSVNFLTPTGHLMHQQFNIQQL